MRPPDGVLSGFRLAGPHLRQSSVPMISETHQWKNGKLKIDRQMHWQVTCSALLNFTEVQQLEGVKCVRSGEWTYEACACHERDVRLCRVFTEIFASNLHHQELSYLQNCKCDQVSSGDSFSLAAGSCAPFCHNR